MISAAYTPVHLALTTYEFGTLIAIIVGFSLATHILVWLGRRLCRPKEPAEVEDCYKPTVQGGHFGRSGRDW